MNRRKGKLWPICYWSRRRPISSPLLSVPIHRETCRRALLRVAILRKRECFLKTEGAWFTRPLTQNHWLTLRIFSMRIPFNSSKWSKTSKCQMVARPSTSTSLKKLRSLTTNKVLSVEITLCTCKTTTLWDNSTTPKIQGLSTVKTAPSPPSKMTFFNIGKTACT